MTGHPRNGTPRGTAGVNIGDAISTVEPDALAIAETDGRQVTYGEFLRRIFEVQADLAARKIERGDHVAIIGLNSIDWLAAFYGVMRAGAVIIPISHKFPAPVLDYVLDNSDPSLILVDRDDRTTRRAVRLDVLGSEDREQPEAADVGWDDPALVLYTSGSTGRPKGVVRSHGSHAWILDQGERAADSGRRTILVAAPLYHMNGLATVQAALLHGDRVVLQPAFEARGFLRAIAEHCVTKTTGVPPMMALALREKDLLAELDLSSVTEHSLGSAPLTDDLIDDIEAAFPNSALSIGYGTTESGPVAFAPPDGRPTPKNSVGVAHPAVRIRLLDENGLIVVTDGADAGEAPAEAFGSLSISSPASFSRYLGGPASPVDEEGFYPTGDLFRRDAEGFYTFAGRVDDMFASGGENVHPAVVEQILLEHPAVREAAVVPVADEVKGAKPVAFVVICSEVSEQDLKEWTLERLEPYAHPRRVFFTDAMPLSGTNKVDKNALAERATALLGGGA